MKRLLIVVAALMLTVGAAEARHSSHGGRSCYRGSYYGGHSRYSGHYRGWGCGPYYRGWGSYIGGAYYGSGYGFALGFGSGACYPRVAVSYSAAWPAYYTYPTYYAYPSVYGGYYPPATYVYPSTVATVQSASSAAMASATVEAAATPPPAPATVVKGWYHPTYKFHCQCHGFHTAALENHSYLYDTSKD